MKKFIITLLVINILSNVFCWFFYNAVINPAFIPLTSFTKSSLISAAISFAAFIITIVLLLLPPLNKFLEEDET